MYLEVAFTINAHNVVCCTVEMKCVCWANYDDFFSRFLPSSETTVVIDAIRRLVLDGVANGSRMTLGDPILFRDFAVGVWAVSAGLELMRGEPGSSFGFFRAGSDSKLERAACLVPRVGVPIPVESCESHIILHHVKESCFKPLLLSIDRSLLFCLLPLNGAKSPSLHLRTSSNVNFNVCK